MPLPTSIDEALGKLNESAQSWQDLSDKDRAAVAKACRQQFSTLDTLGVDWIAANLRVQGIEPSKPDYYNYLGFDPFVFTATSVERFDKVVDKLEGKFKDLTKEPIRRLPEDGPVVYDMGKVGIAAPGCTIEMWSAKSGDAKETPKGKKRGISVVLGAGNQNFLTIVDVVERVFVHKEVVFVKHHPLRPHLFEVCKHIFAPLAEKGVFAQCLDSDLASAHAELICHKLVTHIHVTGSGATHDKILATLKAGGREDEVELTSELGCVTPWIYCPGTANNGKWQDAEIEHHAAMLTSAFKANSSMNCLSPKLLVFPSEEIWPQRKQFLEVFRKKLASVPSVPPYYPGAHQRWTAFEKEYSDGEKIESPTAQAFGDGVAAGIYPGQDFKPLPSLIVDVGVIGSSDCRTYALQNEAFSPVIAFGTVKSESAKDFPLEAAKAVNKLVFGTLSCTLIWPDERGPDFDRVVRELKYGCVGINVWSALGYGTSLGIWGAAPGSYSKDNPQSGLDFIGNYADVPNASKSVIISPFVNKGVALDKAIPMLVAECLQIFISGQSFAVAKILGKLVTRAFGLIGPRLPPPPGQAESRSK